MKNAGINLAEEVAKESVKRENRWYKKMSLAKTAIIMGALLLITLAICGTVLAWHTISELQYANNMQYAEMADIARGTNVYEATEGGVAIAGQNTVGGDVVGGKNSNAQPEEETE